MNKIRFNQKLLFKIFLTILLVTFLTLVIVGFLSFYSSGTVFQKSIMENELQIARHTMDKIDRMLYERYLDIQAIAGEESFANYLHDFAQGVQNQNKLNYHAKRLQNLAIVSGPWNTLFIIDLKGTIILSTLEGETGKSVDRWFYKNVAFKKAVQGKINYSDFVILKHTAEPAVVFAAPIRDNTNPARPIVGAVVGDLAWMSVVQILEDITRDSAILLNHQGNIIAHNTQSTQTANKIDQRQGQSLIKQLLPNSSQSMVIDHSQGIFHEDTLASLIKQKGYLSYKGSEWVLVLSESVHSVFAPANQSALQIAFILLPIIVFMSVGILFILHRIIIHPIDLLTQTVRDISSGDLNKRALIVSNDEIGQLAVSFNEMTAQLRDSYKNLEDKIKQRTSELRESQEQSRSIIETANDAFVSMNKEGLICDWNRGAENIFGWSRSEIMGKSMAETIIPPQYREKHTRGLSHFVKTGEGPVLGKTLELSALRHSGHEFPIEITIWSIRSGDALLFNAFVRDISERKKTEEQLKAIYKDLEDREKSLRNAFSDLQKAHDELKQTQAQLLQSEKLASIGQLAAGVAHEINNPIGFINNNMEVLSQYIADYGKILRMVENLKSSIEEGSLEKAKLVAQQMSQFEKEINLDYIINDINNLLEHNQRGIERIQKIVLDLRTFAREDKDTMELIKIEEVIDSILSIVQNELKYKAELKKNYADTPLVKCNAQRMGQVFINLFVNAAQAMEEKGTIEVRTYVQGNFICIDVADTGKGIPSENLGKIFDAFFTTKPVGQGTGLGLSVSYEIVKKHGGEIKVKSRVGEGTRFTVMLPMDNQKES